MHGTVSDKVQGRSCKFANCPYTAPWLALICESPSGVAEGLCATPRFSLLQSRNELPWNRLTFGVILFFSPSQGHLTENQEKLQQP